MTELEIYTHIMNCTNCGKHEIVGIEKGRTIAEYEARATCKNCGCKVRATEPEYRLATNE